MINSLHFLYIIDNVSACAGDSACICDDEAKKMFARAWNSRDSITVLMYEWFFIQTAIGSVSFTIGYTETALHIRVDALVLMHRKLEERWTKSRIRCSCVDYWHIRPDMIERQRYILDIMNYRLYINIYKVKIN